MRLFSHCGLGVQILGLILAQIAAVITRLMIGIILLELLLNRILLETLQVIPRYLPISFHDRSLIIFLLQGQIKLLTLINYCFLFLFFIFNHTVVFITQAIFFISENVHTGCELACTAHQLSQIFDALLGAIQDLLVIWGSLLLHYLLLFRQMTAFSIFKRFHDVKLIGTDLKLWVLLLNLILLVILFTLIIFYCWLKLLLLWKAPFLLKVLVDGVYSAQVMGVAGGCDWVGVFKFVIFCCLMRRGRIFLQMDGGWQ